MNENQSSPVPVNNTTTTTSSCGDDADAGTESDSSIHSNGSTSGSNNPSGESVTCSSSPSSSLTTDSDSDDENENESGHSSTAESEAEPEPEGVTSTGGGSEDHNDLNHCLNNVENIENHCLDSNAADSDGEGDCDGDSSISSQVSSMSENEFDHSTSRDNDNDNEDEENESPQPRKKSKLSIEYIASETLTEYLIDRGYNDMYEKNFDKTIPMNKLLSNYVGPLSSLSDGLLYNPKFFPSELERFWNFYKNIKKFYPQLTGDISQLLIPCLAHFCEISSLFGYYSIIEKLKLSFLDTFFKEDISQTSKGIIYSIKRYLVQNELQKNNIQPLSLRYEKKFLICESAFEKLKKFLTSSQNPSLILILTRYFTIIIQESKDLVELFDDPSDSDSESDVTNHKKENEISKEKLPNIYGEENIWNLRANLKDNLPSIINYTTNSEPISAAISSKGSIIGYGMKNGQISCSRSTTARNLYHQLVTNFETNDDDDEVDISKNAAKIQTKPKSSPSKPSRRMSTATKEKQRGLIGKKLDNLLADIDDSDAEEEYHFTNKKTRLKSPKAKANSSNFDSIEERLKPVFLSGHVGCVYDLKFHPNGKLLYSVGEDETMRLWDLNSYQDQDYKCLAVYKGHIGSIWCLDITKSGNLIATGSSDKTAMIWVGGTQTASVRILQGHHLDVECVKFHPNEAYLATGSSDKSIRLWSISDGNTYRMFTGFKAGVNSIEFHESGKYIIAGGEDSRIKIWDISTSDLIIELSCPYKCRDISLFGNMLSGCFSNNSLYIWNLLNVLDSNFKVHRKTEIYRPKKFKIEANSLLKLYYQDLSTLYCIGQDSKEEWFVLNRSKDEECVLPKIFASKYESCSNKTKIDLLKFLNSDSDSDKNYESGNISTENSDEDLNLNSENEEEPEYLQNENEANHKDNEDIVPVSIKKNHSRYSVQVQDTMSSNVDSESNSKAMLSSSDLTERILQERRELVVDEEFKLFTAKEGESEEYEQDQKDIFDHINFVNEIIGGENQNLQRDISETPQFLDEPTSLYINTDDISFIDIPEPSGGEMTFDFTNRK